MSSCSGAGGGSARRRFRTQSIPACLACGSSLAASGPALADAVFSLHADQRPGIAALRRLGCCSGGGAGGGGSAGAAAGRQWPERWQRQQRRWPLPLASMTGQQSGGFATAAAAATERQQQQQRPPAASAPQDELEAQAKAATAPDVFGKGDVLGGGRYRLLHKLGEGEGKKAPPAPLGLTEGRFTTVWEGEDLASGQHVVLKLVEAGDATSYVAGTREAALHALAGRHPNVLPLLDAFEHRSPGGRHACMVLEKAGSNLMMVEQLWGTAMMAATPLGLRAIKNVARQSLQALEHLHSRGLVHMDLSLDNLLVDRPFVPSKMIAAGAIFSDGWQRMRNLLHLTAAALGVAGLEGLQGQVEEAHRRALEGGELHLEFTLPSARVLLCDFGRAVPYRQLGAAAAAATAGQAPGGPLVGDVRPLGFNRDGPVVMGDPGLRPPEEVLGLDYAAPAYDIWRLGCVLFELALSKQPFAYEGWGKDRERIPALQRYSDDALHLLDMQYVLGNPPRDLIRRSPLHRDFFLPNDELRAGNAVGIVPGSGSVHRHLSKLTEGAQHEREALKLAELIEAMLVYDPARRPSAAELLQSRWFAEGDGGEVEQQGGWPSGQGRVPPAPPRGGGA